MLNYNFYRTPSFSLYWKSGENLNPEQSTKNMLAGKNFTENFNADVLFEIFRNV